MIILDTNIISETMRQVPNRTVVAWLDEQSSTHLYICAPVVAELCYGVARLPASSRKDELASFVSNVTQNIFNGRILAFDSAAAKLYGDIVASREVVGRPIKVVDAMIAAIVRSSRATLATRNVADFDMTGVSVINPFEVHV